MADLKGLKRICMSCGARFYDLNKKPIICPSCSVEFTGEIKVKARRGRLPVDAIEAQADDEIVAVEEVEEEAETEEIEAEEGVVSLEDLDEEDAEEEDIDLEEDLSVLDEDDLDDIEDDDIEEDIAEEDDK